jgi:competence protein ComEA
MALALASKMVFAGAVNINTADARTLAKELAGVGPSKAEAIVKYRTDKGPFKSAEELKKVEGIGESTYEHNKASIKVKD